MSAASVNAHRPLATDLVRDDLRSSRPGSLGGAEAGTVEANIWVFLGVSAIDFESLGSIAMIRTIQKKW